MPLYTYRCSLCAATFREFRSIANRHDAIKCECGGDAAMKIEAPQVQAQILGGGTYPGYKCPITGEYVTSRKRRRDIMAEHNVVEAGDSSSKERRSQVLESNKGHI